MVPMRYGHVYILSTANNLIKNAQFDSLNRI